MSLERLGQLQPEVPPTHVYAGVIEITKNSYLCTRPSRKQLFNTRRQRFFESLKETAGLGSNQRVYLNQIITLNGIHLSTTDSIRILNPLVAYGPHPTEDIEISPYFVLLARTLLIGPGIRPMLHVPTTATVLSDEAYVYMNAEFGNERYNEENYISLNQVKAHMASVHPSQIGRMIV